MAWEWVPPVSGAVVACTGSVVGYLVIRSNQKHSERLAVSTFQQERLAEAYVAVLANLHDMGLLVERIWPTCSSHPKEPTKPPKVNLSREAWEANNVRLLAFASDEVNEGVAAISAVYRAIDDEALRLYVIEAFHFKQSATAEEWSATYPRRERIWKKLNKGKTEFRNVQEALITQVRKELGATVGASTVNAEKTPDSSSRGPGVFRWLKWRSKPKAVRGPMSR